MKNIIISLFIAASFAAAAPVNYTYDVSGRLTVIDYGAGGSITYTYDAAGNIISRVVQSGSLSPSVIASVRLSADGTRIELTGTNLASADGVDVAVTVNGQPARVLAACSASVKGSRCRADRLTVEAGKESSGRLEVRVRNGGHQEAVWR